MKLDCNTVIKGFDDKPTIGEGRIPITFQIVLGNILMLVEQNMTAEKKQTAYQLGLKLYNPAGKGILDATVDQVSFLKERVGLFGTPLVYGRFLELIGDPNKEE